MKADLLWVPLAVLAGPVFPAGTVVTCIFAWPLMALCVVVFLQGGPPFPVLYVGRYCVELCLAMRPWLLGD